MKRRHIIMASKSAKRLLVNKVIKTFKTSNHNETQIYKNTS